MIFYFQNVNQSVATNLIQHFVIRNLRNHFLYKNGIPKLKFFQYNRVETSQNSMFAHEILHVAFCGVHDQ